MTAFTYENDRKVLRQLACEYFDAVHNEQIVENLKLHKAVNDLHMIRPVVLLDELPWHELNTNGELTLQCQDPYLREVEEYFRKTLYKYRHLPADMTIPAFVPVRKIIHNSGVGIGVEEHVIANDAGSNISSHDYLDQLATEEDLKKLHMPVITYDKEETFRRAHLVSEMLGDILPVKICGAGYLYAGIWDNISRYRGVSPLLLDLALRPEFMHTIAKTIFASYHCIADQYEKLGLFDADSGETLHCTPIATDDLPKRTDGEPLTARNVWGRGMAQIFVSVSKAMREEFDIQYMKDLMARFGMAYYGCCEPLDTMVDLVAQIPNLRKIGVTPWADVQVAAEAIGKKYVASVKPNPSAVAVGNLNKDTLKKEIGNILDAVKKNGCSADITLKDISTCGGRPENLFEWERTVMDMVRNF